MRHPSLGLAPDYAAALREHLQHAGEHGLHRAYELGRRALREGVGVIDLVAVHHDALADLMLDTRGEDPAKAMAPAAEFLAECLSPFEMTLRGYQEANERLAAANAELSGANAAVVSANAMLKAEAAERKRAEEALLHAQKLQAVGIARRRRRPSLQQSPDGHPRQYRACAPADRRQCRGRRFPPGRPARRPTGRGGGAAAPDLLAPADPAAGASSTRRAGSGADAAASAALGGHIAVEVEADASVWPLEVDPSELELTLLNLGVNARDAMPEGGLLKVTAENRALDDDRLGSHGHFVLISVADTGVGVAPEPLKRVFEPFFTTKSLGPGAGLGLSQVHGFVHQSGGEVEMDSVLGHGATVRLYLPAATHRGPPRRPRRRRGAVRREASAAFSWSRTTPTSPRSAAALLRNCGYSVKLADRAQSALDMMQGGERVDLIFSDVVMPGMTGVQLAEELRRRFPELPILLATGYSDVIAGAEAKGLSSSPSRTRPRSCATGSTGCSGGSGAAVGERESVSRLSGQHRRDVFDEPRCGLDRFFTCYTGRTTNGVVGNFFVFVCLREKGQQRSLLDPSIFQQARKFVHTPE